MKNLAMRQKLNDYLLGLQQTIGYPIGLGKVNRKKVEIFFKEKGALSPNHRRYLTFVHSDINNKWYWCQSNRSYAPLLIAKEDEADELMKQRLIKKNHNVLDSNSFKYIPVSQLLEMIISHYN